jgi:glycosyltransferase involved in cell wall biosynthesis
MLKKGYDLGISAFYGLEGNVLPWKGIPVYPGISTDYGDRTIADHARVHFGPDLRSGLLVTLMDVWPLSAQIWRGFNVASWVPVDHEPCPRPVADYFHDTGAVPIAMSKFGQRELRAAGLDPLYCPHGVDTEVYKPHDKKQARDKTGMPQDAFLVGMVAANKGNPSRKNFSEAIQAFKVFHAKHPEARLYLHSEATGIFDGVHLPALISDIGLDMNAVIFPDQYRMIHYPFTDETMANIYSSLDVLLSPSAGEGFGIPVIEAQACGVPVIVSDFSAQPELCGSGWLVSGEKFYTAIRSWQFRPDVADIADALRQSYKQTNEHREKARAHALQYDAKRVYTDHLLPSLQKAAQRFEDRKPVELAAA